MSEIKPIRVSDDEYNGCSDEQIKHARDRMLEQEDKKFLKFFFV